MPANFPYRWLRAGDCLLYRPKGLFGRIIQVKTWHPIAHCEVYAGNAMSWASRDGIGVNLYPLREAQLAHVLRPTKLSSLALQRAEQWAMKRLGTKYGWLELLNFVGLHVQNKGMFCSQFVVEFYRAGGWNIFPEDRADQVAPFEFLNLVNAGFKEILHA